MVEKDPVTFAQHESTKYSTKIMKQRVKKYLTL